MPHVLPLRSLASFSFLGPLAFLSLAACGGEGIETGKTSDAIVNDDGCGTNGSPGSSCTDNAACGPAAYCHKGCDDARGTCRALPNQCQEIYQPTCGCDGVVYTNACDAVTRGVNVRHEGPCAANGGGGSGGNPGTGGGSNGNPGTGGGSGGGTPGFPGAIACAADAECGPVGFCKKTSCGAAAGVCTPAPTTCIEIYAPVCGCDGVTYSSSCFAAGGRTNVRAEGACAPPGSTP